MQTDKQPKIVNDPLDLKFAMGKVYGPCNPKEIIAQELFYIQPLVIENLYAWRGKYGEGQSSKKMFCIPFNYSRCENVHCDQPHWCAICFKFGHDARRHRHTDGPLQDVSIRETKWFFGGWRKPLIMMYENVWRKSQQIG